MKDIFVTNKNTLQCSLRFVHFSGADSWNSISTAIKESESLVCICYKLKSSLLAKKLRAYLLNFLNSFSLPTYRNQTLIFGIIYFDNC